MYYTIKDVQPYQDYKLILTFENGEKKVFDMSPYLDRGIFKELRDKKMFDTVRVSFDSIEWDNEADFDPEILYEKGHKVE